jgi:peptidoglycan/LPS O-acetylase OafA/YrhL
MIAKAPVEVALTIISQFFMLHGWIPERLFYFSLNSPSWSISTEFFFYLAFPLLIINLRKNWLPKLVAMTALPVALVLLARLFNLPPLGAENQISSHGLLYINPLSRIFEFYLGMLTCLVVTKLKTSQLNRAVLTVTEIGAFALIAALLCNIEPWLFRLGLNSSAPQLLIYLKYCGNALGYVLLIATVGIERGYVSKLLKLPVLIFLGEVSYSVYLLHYPLLILYKQNTLLFLTMPRFLRYGLFWAALLAFSSISYFLLEKPARKFSRKLFTAWIQKLDPKLDRKPA